MLKVKSVKSNPLKPKKASSKGAFPLDIREGDTLRFDGEQCHHYRGEQCLGRYSHAFEDESSEPLQKAVERKQLGLVPGTETKVKGPNVTSMGKADPPKGQTGVSAKPKQAKEPETQSQQERWLTLHPDKNDPEKYVRVKVRVHQDGTASVIAGAGGKLNQLHLTKLKSPEEWKQNAADRRRKREEKERKRQEAQSAEQQDQEQESLKQAKEYHRGEKHQNALETIKALEELGIDHGLSDEHKDALAVAPSEDTDPEEAKQVEALAKQAVKQAENIQRAYEKKLVTDHEARAAAQLGDEPLETLGNTLVQDTEHHATDADGEDISSITKLPNGQWLVRSQDDADQTFDDWERAAKAHAGNVAEHDSLSGEQSQDDDFYNPKLWVKSKDETLPEGFEFRADAAGKIAALAAQRKDIDRSSKAAVKAIKQGQPWDAKKGFDVGGVTDVDPETALKNLEQDAKTIEDAIVNGQLLDLADMLDAKGLKKHLSLGGAAKLGEISSDVLKVDVVDPGLVSALGHNEAAKLLAYQMRQNMTAHEYDLVTAAQAAHHADMSTKLAQQCLDENQPLVDELKRIHTRMMEIEAGKEEDYTPDQLIELDNLAYQSRTLQDALQKSVGTVLGQLQASAAMTLALESKPRSVRFAVDGDANEVGDVPGLFSRESDDGEDKPSIWKLYGLEPDDFSLEDGPDSQLVTVKPSGMAKLVDATYDPADREDYERAIAIKRGDFDQENFTPNGFAYRPKSTFTDLRAEAQQFDTELAYRSDMSDEELDGAIRSYLGARVANGENPLSVRNDLFSPELYANLGLGESDSERLRGAVDALDRDLFKGQKASDSAIRQAYQGLGDAEAANQRAARATDDMQALHSQSLDEDISREAAHRTLAAMPMARAAMKPLEQLTPRERKYLREYAITEILGEELEGPEAAEEEPTGVSTDEPAEDFGMGSLFGGPVLSPDQQNAVAQLQSQRDQLRAQYDAYKISKEDLDAGIADLIAKQAKIESGEVDAKDALTPKRGPTQWQNFSKLMGGDAKAYEAVRDKLKGQFLNRFASAYSSINGKPILTGQQTAAHVDRLMAASLPEDKRQELLDHMRSLQSSDIAKIRRREGGKFAVEVDDILDKYEELKGDNRQMSLLTTETKEQGDSRGQFQRTTLGANAEQQLQDAIAEVGPGFDQIDSAVNLYPEVTWNGGFVAHQRALKMLQERKRLGLHFSAGAGKSAAFLGAFTHLHSEEAVQRSIVAVPSGIIGQIVGECATFLEPGKYNYSANMGWGREQRIEALKNPDMHLHFTTRESLANDLLHLVEKHTGVSADDFQDTNARSEDDRRSLMLTALQNEGIDPKSLLFSVDEAHDLARRKGVAPSKRSLALDALAYHSGHYLHGTGTPNKNDVSEIGDFLQKIGAPEAEDMGAFMARYGKNTEANQRALQRIMGKYSYAIAVKPQTADGQELQMKHEKPRIPLTDYQKTQRQDLLNHYETIRQWKARELPKVMAAKAQKGDQSPLNGADLAHAFEDEGVRSAIAALAPDDYHGMSDEDKAAAIGGQVIGASAMKYTALNRLYHNAPYEHNAKAQHAVKTAVDMVQQGKPTVIFAASSQAATMLREQLAKEGQRVGYIDGTMSSEQKSKERLRFSPGKGVEPETDILVVTDSCQTGLNLQRGKALLHFDVPITQKAFDQRSARIYRRGQTEDVEVQTLMADAPEDEIALARMDKKGRESRIFQGHDETLGHSEVIDDSGLAGRISQMRGQLPQAA
jgi:hypothetical protein